MVATAQQGKRRSPCSRGRVSGVRRCAVEVEADVHHYGRLNNDNNTVCVVSGVHLSGPLCE